MVTPDGLQAYAAASPPPLALAIKLRYVTQLQLGFGLLSMLGNAPSTLERPGSYPPGFVSWSLSEGSDVHSIRARSGWDVPSAGFATTRDRFLSQKLSLSEDESLVMGQEEACRGPQDVWFCSKWPSRGNKSVEF